MPLGACQSFGENLLGTTANGCIGVDLGVLSVPQSMVRNSGVVMIRRAPIRTIAFAVVCVGLVCHLAGCDHSAPPPARKADEPQPTVANPATFSGTASCSGRGCHGGAQPREKSDILRNEFTTWLADDKHADAYAVLLTERSQKIADRLGFKHPPHTDTRCLCCHMTPYAAAGHPGMAVEQPLETVSGLVMSYVTEEEAFGVGCESCHGNAKSWLQLHTLPDWKSKSPEEKRKLGMLPVGSTYDLAKSCAGCHVGARPDSDVRIGRDVNHDLIAAGHPQLHFEFTSFLANLPPHWKVAAKDETEPARSWALGQLATSDAALALLAHRAQDKDSPWPEFTEYDCFACHHDLQGKSWRQERGYGKRTPGLLPWGSWYMTMPRLLDGATPGAGNLSKPLQDLENEMRRPLPDRKAVPGKVQSVRDQLEKLRAPILAWNGDRKLLGDWLVTFGKDQRLTDEMNWDAAEQLYQAMYSLNPELVKKVDELPKKLAFPHGFDSPREFTPDDVRDLRKRLQTP
jgi:hypothetical protein